MKNYLLQIFMLLSITTSYASWYPPIVNYSQNNSLTSRQNWKIAQGSNGWIYSAHNSGLLEFDGVRWITRQLDNRSIVRSLKATDDGRIYVGGVGEIGCFMADEMGRLTYTNLTHSLDESMFPLNDVWGIQQANGQIYFQLRRGILVMDRYGEFSKIVSDDIISASCVMNNSVYYTTSRGLNVITGSESISIQIDGELPFSDVSAITPYGESELLIATNFSGLFIYSRGHVTQFNTEKRRLFKDNQIFSIAVGRESIACGTVRGGVIIMNHDGGNIERIDISSGLNNNTVLSVMYDSDDNLWCGLDNGIDCIKLSSPLRHSDMNRLFKFSGYYTLQDSSYLYLGSNQGLIRLHNRDGSSLSRIRSSWQEVTGSEGQVWSLKRIDDRVYCCHNRGLFELRDADSDNPTLRSIYNDDGVWSIEQVSANRFVAGTYDGVILIERDGDRYSVQKVEGCEGSVRDMVLIPQLRMGFFISENGLERLFFDREFRSVKHSRLLENNAYEITLLEFDGLLLACSPQEIYQINDDGSVQTTSQFDTLFDRGTLYSMISVDDRRNIWYISNSSLMVRRYHPERELYDESCDVILTDDSLFIPGFTRLRSFDDRYCIINSVDGFLLVDSSSRDIAHAEEVKPLVSLLHSTTSRDSLLMSCAYGVSHERITLPHALNSLQFVYSYNTVNQSTVEHSYRLVGVDKQWSDWVRFTNENTPNISNRKEYTQLYEGEYQFQLRVRSENGSIEESAITVVISPPWYRSNFMYVIYVLLLVSIMWAILYRVRLVNADRRQLIILRSKRQMEQQRRLFESQAMQQENSIIKLEKEKLEREVQVKSIELSSLLLNKLEKNDIITSTKSEIEKIRGEVVTHNYDNILKRLSTLNRRLDDKLIDNIDWSAFEENFNITNNNFLQKISERYSWMTLNERKLCVYIKLGLQNKEISPLLNLSVRGVEMLRYRIRKKMNLDRNENLYEFFQRLESISDS